MVIGSGLRRGFFKQGRTSLAAKRVLVIIALSVFSHSALSEESTVTLTFAWPNSVSATIESVLNMADTYKGEEGVVMEDKNLWHTTNLIVSDQPSGIQLSYELVKSSYHSHPSEEATLAQLWEFAFTNIPSFVVSDAGEFQSVTNPQEFIDSLRQKINDKFGDKLNQVPDTILNEIGEMFEPDALSVASYNNWYRDVEQWIGLEMVVAKPYQETSVYEFPFIEFAELPAITTTTLLGFLPCDAKPDNKDISHAKSSGDNASCVELELVASLDQDAVAEFVEKTNAANSAGSDVNWKPNLYYKLNVITEPTTLLPHAVREADVVSLLVDDFPALLHQEVVEHSYQYK